jgi:hypothetical protein
VSTANVPDIGQLQELALPVSSVSYFPQTWGWLALLLLLVFSAVLWGVLRWRRWRRNAYRREALARLDALAKALDDQQQRLSALRELPELLKRVALSIPIMPMPDAPAVARLSGKEWQAFLAAHSPTPLPNNFSAMLFGIAYAPDARLQAMPDTEIRSLVTTSRCWIDTHFTETHHVAV